jgi:predicted transcriptional regulator
VGEAKKLLNTLVVGVGKEELREVCWVGITGVDVGDNKLEKD